MARQTRGECNMSAEAVYEAMGSEGYEVEGTWENDGTFLWFNALFLGWANSRL